MLFSIIVPIYNIKQFLHQCIVSILAQTYDNFELILVDDGSTDGSAEICDDFQRKDKRISVVHKKNGGLTSARKRGLELANGNYIMCVDGDDYIDNNLLYDVNNILHEHQYDIVCFEAIAVGVAGHKTIPIGQFRYGAYNREELEKEIFNQLITGVEGIRFSPNLCFKVIKKDLIYPVQMQLPDDIIIGEDSCVSYPCIYNAASMFILNKQLYYYRMNQDSLTHQRKKSLSWEEPLRRAEFYQKFIRNDKFDFDMQIARITSHSLFNVTLSVLRVKKYREARAEIISYLSEKNFKYYIDKATFKHNCKEKIAHFCLKHKLVLFMFIISKLYK